MPLQTTNSFLKYFFLSKAFLPSRQSVTSQQSACEKGWQSHVTQQSEPRYWHKGPMAFRSASRGNRQGTISQSVGRALLSFQLLLSLERKKICCYDDNTRTRKLYLVSYLMTANLHTACFLYQPFQQRRRVGGGGIMRINLTGGRWFACFFFLFFLAIGFVVLCVCVRSVAFRICTCRTTIVR